MNERIKELLEQANLLGDWGEDITEGRYFVYDNLKNLEKFAELIVRECSQIAHNSHPDDLPFVGGKMLVHFGVE